MIIIIIAVKPLQVIASNVQYMWVGGWNPGALVTRHRCRFSTATYTEGCDNYRGSSSESGVVQRPLSWVSPEISL